MFKKNYNEKIVKYTVNTKYPISNNEFFFGKNQLCASLVDLNQLFINLFVYEWKTYVDSLNTILLLDALNTNVI